MMQAGDLMVLQAEKLAREKIEKIAGGLKVDFQVAEVIHNVSEQSSVLAEGQRHIKEQLDKLAENMHAPGECQDVTVAQTNLRWLQRLMLASLSVLLSVFMWLLGVMYHNGFFRAPASTPAPNIRQASASHTPDKPS